jgi:chromosome partitioning protein
MSATIIACSNHKGGVGKTTTVANLGAALALLKKRVLLVDLDPQGSLSLSLGQNIDELQQTIYTALADADNVSLASVVLSTPVRGLSLAPSNLDLAAAEVEFLSEVGHERILTEVLEPVRSQYDYILIDCPPSLGLLTINALVAAHRVLVPLQAEYLAMRGIKQLFKAVGKVRKRINPELDISILITMATTTVHAREIIDEIRDVRGTEVYQTTIKRSIKFAESSVQGVPIVVSHPSLEQALSYRKLAKEVVQWQPAQVLVGA